MKPFLKYHLKHNFQKKHKFKNAKSKVNSKIMSKDSFEKNYVLTTALKNENEKLGGHLVPSRLSRKVRRDSSRSKIYRHLQQNRKRR